MNWFDTSGLTSLAKSALKEAQKTIDKALDIQDESGDEQEDGPQAEPKTATSPSSSTTAPTAENADFFSSWGLTVSAESPKDEPIKEQPVVTESPSKSTSQNGKYDSQDDLFSKSQLVMTDGEGFEYKNSKSMDSPRAGDRRGSSKSNRLSLVSSRNSSDSVEVLSQSMKTTPDSEVSAQSISHSSSVGQKMNSESVEILPDSLVSPSSIECLGFDSYSSEKNSSSSSILSPDLSDKKLTPIGDRTERAETADSVSLVADDDEDTMSYNSVSECTAPTVLDTEDKSVSPNPKGVRIDAPRKQIDKEFIHIEHTIIPQKMQVSENSSNDGSWSDRTLNADNDSVILDTTTEEQKKELDQEDMLMEKLSDSSSFYNVKVSTDMLRSDSSAFVNVEKLHGSAPESCSSSQKDGSVKERTSPISSDSKSDLVKIGSDRTSGHTSGDDLETTTSSDIEIIPSPNGDNGHGFCRSSPAKYAFKQSKFDGTTSPNLVDLVLGKSLATKIRGHNRELSEASIQSNTSDESQGSENDRLMKRLCEMAEILEARENRLMEVTRSNAELAESNTDLKSQLESLLAKHEMGDVHVITEDYTQRLSALEKKFQQAIREKDQLRKQLDAMKESSSRKNSSEMENVIKEKDEVIMQLQEEGEKLARQQLQHSNIIKKLRAKEKDNEQVIKGLRDKIAEQTSEMDRVKRAIAAKEELEVNQIEAVYRLTTANKKMETELFETKGALDDTSQRLESARTSLDAARAEVTELQRTTAELKRRRGAAARAETERDEAVARAERATAELQQLRADMVQEEQRWITRLESIRRELSSCQQQCASLESQGGGGGWGAGAEAEAASALLAQLAALQRAAVDRDQAHAAVTRTLATQRAEAEASLAKALERERLSRSDAEAARDAVATAEALLRDTQHKLELSETQRRDTVEALQRTEERLQSTTQALERLKAEHETTIKELTARASETEELLAAERNALDTERRRNTILQEQMSSRGDVSPHSAASDSFSGSLWPQDEGTITPVPTTAFGVEEALSTLTRRAGEARALSAAHTQLLAERDALRTHLATIQAELDELRTVQEQYDALLQMYGEKEEQLEEVKLDLQDVTALYKAQLDELIALKRAQR